MSRSYKDGVRGGGHNHVYSMSTVKSDGKCGINGKPTGCEDIYGPSYKRYLKRRTAKSRRRVNKEICNLELDQYYSE